MSSLQFINQDSCYNITSKQKTYPSDIMIDNLLRRKQSLRRNHDSSSGIKVGTGKNKLIGTCRRLSAVSPSDDSAH